VWREENVLQDLKGIMIKLKTVMIRLQGWSNRKFSNVIQELDRNRKKLEQLLLTDGDSEEIREVSDYIDELLYREEMLWLQRSRVAWLKEGDRNTKFFHQKAVWRARKNKVKKFKDEQGIWQDTPSEMERMTTSFFKEIIYKRSLAY
jgi:predicted CopG family antitoxin